MRDNLDVVLPHERPRRTSELIGDDDVDDDDDDDDMTTSTNSHASMRSRTTSMNSFGSVIRAADRRRRGRNTAFEWGVIETYTCAPPRIRARAVASRHMARARAVLRRPEVGAHVAQPHPVTAVAHGSSDDVATRWTHEHLEGTGADNFSFSESGLAAAKDIFLTQEVDGTALLKLETDAHLRKLGFAVRHFYLRRSPARTWLCTCAYHLAGSTGAALLTMPPARTAPSGDQRGGRVHVLFGARAPARQD